MVNLTLQPLDTDYTREMLNEHLPWSPHDYIRTPATAFASDRRAFVAHMTRPLPPEDDLRAQVTVGGVTLAILAERLPWDSDFFGYPIVRLHGIFPLAAYDLKADYSAAVTLWLDSLRARGIRYLFGSVATEDLAAFFALQQTGFKVIETRLIFHRTLADYAYPERFAVRTATVADIPLLAETSRTMVNHYDRFHADPFLDRAGVDRLMEQWVYASLKEDFADITLVPDDPQPRAFVTINQHRPSWPAWGLRIGQPIISAVDTSFRGWYLGLISESAYYLRDVAQADHMIVVTQTTNRAVLRVWEKLGFRFGRTEHVVRKVL